MNEYTASNGVTVYHGGVTEPLGGIRIQESDRCRVMLSGRNTQALREFFAAELGVWVDPETSALVIADSKGDPHNGRYVSVYLDGQMFGLFEKGDRTSEREELVTDRYFAAHPEPKPWHDARPGEVWMLVTTRHEEARAYGVEQEPDGLVFCPAFRADFKSLDVDGAGVKSAHRIYPPEDPS